MFRFDVTQTINRLTECVDDPSEERFAYRDFGKSSCAFGGIPFVYELVFSEQNAPYVVFFEVESDPVDVIRKFDHFTCHSVGKSMHPCNAVAYLQHSAGVIDIHVLFKLLQLLFKDI